MGLLDNLDTPQAQGLLGAAARMLAASGPSRMPTGFGQILGQGWQGFNDSQQAAQQRKLEQDQIQQMAQLRGLQIQEAQGGLQDHERARKQAEALRQVYIDINSPATQAQKILGTDMAPTLDNAAKLSAAGQGPAGAAPQGSAGGIFEQRMGLAQQLRARGFHDQADAQEAAALKFKPKFDNTPHVVMGADGKPVLVQTADDGTVRPIQGGYRVAEKLAFHNLGGRTVGVNPFTGAETADFSNTQSPDSVANNAVTIRGQNMIDQRAAASPDSILPNETVSMMAQQYRAGDTSVMQNLGRGAQGAQNIIKLRNEIARQTGAEGKGGADLAAQNAEYFGTKAGQRAVGTRTANVEMASSEAQSLIPLARQASASVARSGFLPFGKGKIMFDDQTNDPAMRQFAASNNALVNVYSRAISPSGVPTVADKEHARAMLSTAMDDRSYNAVLDQMEKEISAARTAPKTVRNDFSNIVTGRDSEASRRPSEQPAENGTKKFDMLPPATQFDGRKMRADSGTVYVSRGGKWVKE